MSRKVDKAILLLAILLGFISLVYSVDFLSAVTAEPCGAPGANPACYPWDAEGPVAGDWKYASKANYLISSTVFIFTAALAIIVLAPAANAATGLSRLRRSVGVCLLIVAALAMAL